MTIYSFIPDGFIPTSTNDICLFRISSLCSLTWTYCDGVTDPIECKYSHKSKPEWKTSIIKVL